MAQKTNMVTIPLEDAIPIVEMLKHFDPIVYSVSMLEFFGEMPKTSYQPQQVQRRPVPMTGQNI